MVGVCVIGYGLSAKTFQIPYILSTTGLSLHSIVQRSPSVDNDASKDHPTAKIFNSFDDVLGNEDVDLAIISTGNDTHYPFAKRLLEAGKDVVIEKPFTVHAPQAEELIRIAKQNRRLLTVFQNRRWDGDFLTLRDLLSSGVFGTLVSLESHFDRYKVLPPNHSWKTVQKLGNGNTFDLGSHLLDQVVHLWGVPQRIFADIRDERGASADETIKFLEKEGFIDDSFDLLLYYDRVKDSTKIPKQGLRVKLSSTTSSLVPKQLRYVVRGTLAGYIKHGLDPQEPQTKAGMTMSDPKFGAEEEDMWGMLTRANGVSERVETKKGVYKKFFEYLANGQAPVDPEEVLGVIRVIEAAGVSVREGRVVDL